MKTRLMLVMMIPLVALAAPGRNGAGIAPAGAGAGAGACGAGVCGGAVCPLTAAVLTGPTTLAVADVTFGVEEERMAGDLYRAASARWGLRVFDRVGAAEEQHEAAFVRLAASANVSLPPANPGVYANAELQTTYARLLALVNESPSAALRAAALVEETDLADLRRMRASVTDAGTAAVLEQLAIATQAHLRAMVRNLAALGQAYAPQVLTAEDFAAIMAGDDRPACRRGRG